MTAIVTKLNYACSEEDAMYDEIREAYNMANRVYIDYIGGATIALEDKDIIQKYIDLGLITLKRSSKRDFGKKLYFPTIQAEEFRGLSMVLWLNINRALIQKYDIPSQLGKASMAEYVSKYWQYNIEPTVVNKTAAGSIQLKEEADALVKILEEEKLDYILLT